MEAIVSWGEDIITGQPIMRNVDLIVLHCSDTDDENNGVDAATIRKWHVDPPPYGNGWLDIGYHYVITRSGDLQLGRALAVPGAHVMGQNKNSVGICLVGREKYEFQQWFTLLQLLFVLKATYKNAKIVGHCDLDTGKTCPNFKVSDFLSQAAELGYHF